MFLQVSAASASKKLVVKVILGLVAFALVAAVTLTAVYLGGKITKEAVKVMIYLFFFRILLLHVKYNDTIASYLA